MTLSYFWSIDTQQTLKAIPKESSLLLIPTLFCFIPTITTEIKQKIIKYYSYSIVLFVLFFIARAVVKYLITGDSRAFFYHGEYDNDFGLVPKVLNAIHVSVYVVLAFFYFFTKEIKSKLESVFALFLFCFMLLLSSKNVIIISVLLVLVYLFYYSKSANRMRLRNAVILLLLVGFFVSFSKVKERFIAEFKANNEKSLSSNVIDDFSPQLHRVSIYEAWNNEQFTPNDFFNGTAFRTYQTRMFIELTKENNIFLTGFGLNASKVKLEEKGKQYNVFLGDNNNEGYQKKNFHNQYIQNFADLGLIGFCLLLIILGISLKKAVKTKDFIHIAFTVLMISVFLTESLLWRQRGVVFFTAFYCLFMISQKNVKIK